MDREARSGDMPWFDQGFAQGPQQCGAKDGPGTTRTGGLHATHTTSFCHGGRRRPAAIGLAAIGGAANAQGAYPSRPITIIVPFAAGGPTDVITRIVTQHMSQTLGQQFVVENVVGAGGTVGATRAARATNDGYTLITGHVGTHAASVALYPDLQYHPEKDFEPVALLAGTPIVILAKKDFPAKDLGEFVTQVKANSAKMNQAHAGVGSVSHISCILLNSQLGAKPVGIPFNGTGPAMNALIAGQIDYMCDQIVNAVPQIQSGTIKGYAVATPERNPSLPDLPTTSEAGLPAYQASAWNAIFAPKGTPEAILVKLNDAAAKALSDDNVRKRLLDLGSDIPNADGRTRAVSRQARHRRDRQMDAGAQGRDRGAAGQHHDGAGQVESAHRRRSTGAGCKSRPVCIVRAPRAKRVAWANAHKAIGAAAAAL